MSLDGSDSPLYATPHEFEKEFVNVHHTNYYYDPNNITTTAAAATTPTTSSSFSSAATTSVGVDFGVTILNSDLGGTGNGTSFSEQDYYGGHNPQDYTEERNWAVVGVLIALIIMLWLILGAMLCYPIMRFLRRKIPVSKRRINRRYETIEGWLITKVVRPHDEGCEQIQRKGDDTTSNATHNATSTTTTTTTTNDVENLSVLNTTTTTTNNNNNTVHPPDGMKHAESYDTGEITAAISDSFCLFDSYDEEEQHEEEEEEVNDRDCPICMEPFAVGDVVSWSSYEKCSHVYHHQCIKEWLLRHNNCPFCREIFLPVDRANTKITMKVFRELSDLRAKRAEKTYYCVQDGLVTLEEKPPCQHSTGTTPPTTSTTTAAAAAAASNINTNTIPILRKCGHIKSAKTSLEIKEKLKPGVTKADLKKLRGDRAETICMGDTPHDDSLDNNNHNNRLDRSAIANPDGEGEIETRDVEDPAVAHPEVPEEVTTDRNDSLTTIESSSEEEDDALASLVSDETDRVVEAGWRAGGFSFQCAATGLVFEEAFAAIGGSAIEEESNTQIVEETVWEETLPAMVSISNKQIEKEAVAHDDEENPMDAPIEWELNEADVALSTPSGGEDDIESQGDHDAALELNDSEDTPKVEGDIENQLDAAIELDLNKSDESLLEKSANDETARITPTDEDLTSEASF